MIKKLDVKAQLPSYKSTGASGMDLMALTENSIKISPGSSSLIPTGLSIAIPSECEIQIRPRSGLAAKKKSTGYSSSSYSKSGNLKPYVRIIFKVNAA